MGLSPMAPSALSFLKSCPNLVRFSRMIRSFLFAAFLMALWAGPGFVQERVTPKQAKGGEKQGEAWAEVPETFKSMKIPDWPLPTDRKRWEEIDRAKTRATLLQCLGDLPPRPDPRKVKVVKREDKGEYTLEHFEFHNGADMVVTGLL